MSLPYGIQLGAGITLGAGIGLGASGGGGTPGVNNVTGYNEMPPPIIPGNGLEDGSATINGTTGFIINNDLATGVAISGLTPSNSAWFVANFGYGTHTCTWGPGSTVPSSTINVVQNGSGILVFFIQGQVGPATYNYPFTFSV